MCGGAESKGRCSGREAPKSIVNLGGGMKRKMILYLTSNSRTNVVKAGQAAFLKTSSRAALLNNKSILLLKYLLCLWFNPNVL